MLRCWVPTWTIRRWRFWAGGSALVDGPTFVPSQTSTQLVFPYFDQLSTSARWWSPDGSAITFRSNAIDSFDIWVVGADGRGATRLTTDPSLDSEPTWGASGLIAFMSDRSGNRDIWVMRSDGSNLRRLTADNPMDDRFPAFSPDGSRIVWSMDSGPGARAVGIMDADGNWARRMMKPE